MQIDVAPPEFATATREAFATLMARDLTGDDRVDLGDERTAIVVLTGKRWSPALITELLDRAIEIARAEQQGASDA